MAAEAGPLRVEVARILLTDDVPWSGVGDGTALVVELSVTNGAAQPYTLSAASLSCLMELDALRPGDTRSLTPAGGGEGPFPGGDAAEGAALNQVMVPPGQTRAYWAMFRGYRFPGSDVPRRITLTLPGPSGLGLRVALADPAHGLLRWNVAPAASGWTYGARATTLGGDYSTSTGASTQIARVFRAGRLLWDVGLLSTVLVQTKGRLISQTSSFTGIGLTAHLTAPLVGWGAWQDPRQLGLYAGGAAQLLVELRPPSTTTDPMMRPHVYGEIDAELGLEIDVGAQRLAASPFPLSYQGRPLPRWALRAGFTHTWIGHGTANGYVTGVVFAW
jgi:hypothetical protein